MADRLGRDSQVAESRVVFDLVGPMETKAEVGPAMTAQALRVGRAAMAHHLVVIATKLFGRVNPAHRVKSPKKSLSFRRFPRMLPPTS